MDSRPDTADEAQRRTRMMTSTRPTPPDEREPQGTIKPATAAAPTAARASAVAASGPGIPSPAEPPFQGTIGLAYQDSTAA
jgi:hypothetical protein